jgi:hypothetical protein
MRVRIQRIRKRKLDVPLTLKTAIIRLFKGFIAERKIIRMGRERRISYEPNSGIEIKSEALIVPESSESRNLKRLYKRLISRLVTKKNVKQK